MKILKLDLYSVDLPFRLAFNHNLAKRTYSTNLIVKATLETKSGIITGYGESIPRDYVTGETIESCISLLQNKYFPLFTNQTFSNSQDLLHSLSKQFKEFNLEQLPQGASWCALELALLDAACRSDKIPLSSLIKPDNNKFISNSIRYGATASLTNLKALSALLLFFKAWGFSTIKLKVGKNIEDAISRVKLARKIMGTDTIIRIDANCAWSVNETIEFAQQVESLNLASIEQPLKASDTEGLLYLAASLPQSIVIDESLCTLEQAKNLINQSYKGQFNLRISKLGGLIAASNIKKIADEAGIFCHLGAQVGESAILTMAARIFAFNYGPFINHEGAANSFLLKKDLAKENLTFGYAGYGKLPNKRAQFGLGLTINERFFSQNPRSNSAADNHRIKHDHHKILKIGSTR